MRNVRRSVDEHDLAHGSSTDELARRFLAHPVQGEIGIPGPRRRDAPAGSSPSLTAIERARAAGARRCFPPDPRSGHQACRRRRGLIRTDDRTWRVQDELVVTTGPLRCGAGAGRSGDRRSDRADLSSAPADVRDYRPEVFPAFIQDTGDRHLFRLPDDGRGLSGQGQGRGRKPGPAARPPGALTGTCPSRARPGQRLRAAVPAGLHRTRSGTGSTSTATPRTGPLAGPCRELPRVTVLARVLQAPGSRWRHRCSGRSPRTWPSTAGSGLISPDGPGEFGRGAEPARRAARRPAGRA
ncbi:hypothetical protein HBB16_03140 [Pseudonocardia sp. MCCB 268]|nr:hypothetical protein [Pseudonocardia cytotoxica]